MDSWVGTGKKRTDEVGYVDLVNYMTKEELFSVECGNLDRYGFLYIKRLIFSPYLEFGSL